MPPHPPFFIYGVLVVVFLVIYSLAKPRRGVTDRDLRHTPLGFATLLGCLLYNVFRDTNNPTGNVIDRWVGYLFSAWIAGYLILLYARLHARLHRLTPSDPERPARPAADAAPGQTPG